MDTTRRQLLIGGAALLTASILEFGLLPSPAEGYRLLSASEAALVSAVGEALFPPGNPIGVAAGEVDLPGAVDQLLGESLAPDVGMLFRYTLEGLEVGTRVSRQQSFITLPLPTRMEVVQIWAAESVKPRRMAADALRMVLGMAFFNLPQVRLALGWAPPCEEGRV